MATPCCGVIEMVQIELVGTTRTHTERERESSDRISLWGSWAVLLRPHVLASGQLGAHMEGKPWSAVLCRSGVLPSIKKPMSQGVKTVKKLQYFIVCWSMDQK